MIAPVYCKCLKCGKKLYLILDKENFQYLGLCPVCKVYSTLPDPRPESIELNTNLLPEQIEKTDAHNRARIPDAWTKGPKTDPS
jgi:hypothetical protein